MVWNVDADYNEVVAKVVEAAREFGIPTVTGTKCWLRMPLVTETVTSAKEKQKVQRTWHVEKSRSSATALVHFLKNVGQAAWFFNYPDDAWMLDFKRWNRERSDPSIVEAVVKAFPWGFNPVSLPKSTTDTAEKSTAAKATTSTSSSSRQVTLEPSAKSRPAP